MQNFNSGPNDAVTAGEAQEILAALSNRMATRGVDPSVGSVQGLAAGLGVSEEHVREMLEDIRVHKRSQQIAAGILDEQQKQRKKSDVSAAIVAAIAIVLVGLVIGAFLLFADRGINASTAPVAEPEVPVFGPGPILPPPGAGAPVTVIDNNSITIVGQDATAITIDSTGYHRASPDGTVLSYSGDRAVEAIQKDIEVNSQQVADLNGKKELTAGDRTLSERLNSRGDALRAGLKILQNQHPTTPVPTTEDGP